MHLTRRIVLLVAALAVPVLAVSCSLPADEQVAPIDADDLGDLADPTTTTTTTVPPTTTAPDPAVTEPSTTTTTVVQLDTEDLRLFYTIGSTDDMQRVVLDYISPVALPVVVQALESPRPEVTNGGLRTAVRRNLITSYELDRDSVTLNVELDPALFSSMTEEQRRRAIGQMVLTFTSFTPPDTGSIGYVVFFVDGAPISVFLPAIQSLSEEGAPVRFEDFRSLLGATPVVPGSVPPTSDATTTGTTAPPATSAP